MTSMFRMFFEILFEILRICLNLLSVVGEEESLNTNQLNIQIYQASQG